MAAFDITLFNELAVDECRITQVSRRKSLRMNAVKVRSLKSLCESCGADMYDVGFMSTLVERRLDYIIHMPRH
nr:hypothetical protein [Escherichia coli]